MADRSKNAVAGRALARRHIALHKQMSHTVAELSGPTIFEQLVREQRFDPRGKLPAPRPRKKGASRA